MKKATSNKRLWKVVSVVCLLLSLVFGGLAVRSQRNILVVLFNSEYVTEKDKESINEYCSEFNTRLIDVKDYDDAADIYNLIKSRYSHFYNSIKGVQIFGTKAAVPSFKFDFKCQFVSSDEADDYYKPFYSDFCYSNFEADAGDLREPLNVYDIEKNQTKFDFRPSWQVARVLLGRGKIARYMAKRNEFRAQNQNALPVSAFCCTVLDEDGNPDDCCYFLKERLDKEFGLVGRAYSLYGNRLGEFAIKSAADGEFSVNNLAKENAAGAREFMIFTHGLKDKIIQHARINGEEKALDDLPEALKQGSRDLAEAPGAKFSETGEVLVMPAQELELESRCKLFKIPSNHELQNGCNVLVLYSKTSLKGRCKLLELPPGPELADGCKIWVVPSKASLLNKKVRLELSDSEYLRLEGDDFSLARLVIKAPTIKNVNKVFKRNYYTLNAWCCGLARDLDSKNMISKMMKGRCINAVAATSELANNGTDRTTPAAELEENNPFFFWLEFFKNTAKGKGRGTSFFNAKKAYANAILNHKQLRNYQYNLHNILSLHYFGLVD